MKPVVFAAGLLVAMAGSAHAQSATLCHHAGLTYSPGSMVTMGKSLQKCAAAEGVASWMPSTTEDRALESANCAYDGREYGQGAVVDAVAAVLKCSNGTWYSS